MKETTQIYMPSSGPDAWRQFLAKPDLHWKTGYSARTLANCWEMANGFPPEISALFERSPFQKLRQIRCLLAIPEHKVPLPGGSTKSQNDIFVLGRTETDLVSITVEGKVLESFDKTVGEWLVDGRPRKLRRLRYLQEQLAITGEIPKTIRYQLLHRTASALIEAKNFNAGVAVMLVHSFSQDNRWFDDYKAFLALLGTHGTVNSLSFAREINGVELYCGWATGNPIFLTS